MDNLVIGNMVWNGALVGLAGLLLKDKVTTICAEIKKNAATSASENKEIKKSIEDLSALVAVANGRTTKNEMAIAVHQEHCKQIHEHHRKDD